MYCHRAASDTITHELRTPCLHGACQECLLDLVRKSGRTGAFCPVCRVGPIFEKYGGAAQRLHVGPCVLNRFAIRAGVLVYCPRDLIDLNRAVEGSAVDTREHWCSSTKVRRWHRVELGGTCSLLICADVGRGIAHNELDQRTPHCAEKFARRQRQHLKIDRVFTVHFVPRLAGSGPDEGRFSSK